MQHPDVHLDPHWKERKIQEEVAEDVVRSCYADNGHDYADDSNNHHESVQEHAHVSVDEYAKRLVVEAAQQACVTDYRL